MMCMGMPLPNNTQIISFVSKIAHEISLFEDFKKSLKQGTKIM